jgi:hypothetical protein
VHAALVPRRPGPGKALIVDHSSLHGGWYVLNMVANLMIVAGYVCVPFTVLRYLPLTTSVRCWGTLFFLTCAITHFSMAFGFSASKWMVIDHAVQAVAVVWFVFGFWFLLRAALHRAGAKRRGE